MIGSLTPQCHTELAIITLYDVAFHVNYHVSPLIGNISRLNRIATLLARCLRLTPTITDDSSRLATVGWLNLIQTGFPPVRLIALGWAHNSNNRVFSTLYKAEIEQNRCAMACQGCGAVSSTSSKIGSDRIVPR